jgi:1,4-alpha-glucan branching enzyme
VISKGPKKGSVKFSINPGPAVKQVALAGDFTEWKPVAMKKGKDGSFSITEQIPGGHHEYKFVVDGQWLVDPDNSKWALNAFGTLNSVVQAG